MGLASGELGPTREILGHEGVGHVVRIGSGVSASTVGLGERVAIAWLRDWCEVCASCIIPGGETRCLAHLTSGPSWEGTFAEYAVIPSRYIIRIPQQLDVVADELVAPIVCGGVTAYKALKVSEALPGQWIAISGAGGGVGALGVQFARAMGLRVIALDAGTVKKTSCLENGADAYVDVLEEDVEAVVDSVTQGRGVQAAIVAAGSVAAYAQCLLILAQFGTLVCVGIPPPDQTFAVHPLQFIGKGIRVVGSAVGTRGDILEALEFVRRGVVEPRVELTTLDSLTEIARGFGKVGDVPIFV